MKYVTSVFISFEGSTLYVGVDIWHALLEVDIMFVFFSDKLGCFAQETEWLDNLCIFYVRC